MVDRAARAVADLAEGAIVATVEIEAPVERVFRALTSAEIIKWWGADDSYRTTEWEGDVRPGGRWRAAGVGADGQTFEVKGEYVETEAPNRLGRRYPRSHRGTGGGARARVQRPGGRLGLRLSL